MVTLLCVLHNTQMSQARPTEEAYAELQLAYDFYNRELFDGGLPPCLITFQRLKRTYGYFSKDRFGRRDGRKTDEIALNPEYFAVVPPVEVLQTLVHEMTHLWQWHFGKPSRACYHNTEWADRMEAIGLMPSSTGESGGRRVGQKMADYVIAGGMFEMATARLFATGFEITWLDRYPALPPARTSPPIRGVSQVVGADDTDSYGQHVAALPESVWVAPSETQAHLVEFQKTGNRSNRIKYTCPGCLNNAWGKPKLKLICGECNVPLDGEA